MREVHKKVSHIVKFCLSSRFTLILTFEIIVSVFLCLFALLIFAKLGDDIFKKEVFSFDMTVGRFLLTLRTPLLTQIMMFFTFLGSLRFLLTGSMFMIIYLYTKRRKDSLIYSVILYSGIFINIFLKDIFARPRPTFFEPLVHETSYSFPSFHAMNSFVFYAALAYFLLRVTKKYKATLFISLAAAVIIAIVGVSRVYLGAHYPSDVIGGYVGGFFWLTSAILFEKTIIFKRLYQATKNETQ